MKYLVKIVGLFVFQAAVIFNAKSQQIHKWEVQPIVFTANGQYSNPYAEIPDPKSEDLLMVTFKGVDGEAKDKIIEIVGFRDGGAEAPQWSTGDVLHNEPWLDYNQSQSGHGKYANEMIPLIVAGEYQRQPAKPIVVTEPWYEFVEGNPTGKDIRLAAWGAVLSGAAGHTYGGGHVWLASVPESPSRGGGAWPIEVGAEIESFDYEGAVSMQHLAAFFKKVKWWDMKPSPKLVSDSPQPFCLANPGKEYVVYLRYGGMMHLDMGEAAVGKQFSFYWYNPATGESTSERKITGGRKVQFTAPGMYPATLDYSDWVLHVFENYE